MEETAMSEEELVLQRGQTDLKETTYENVFRRGIVESPKEKLLAKHRLWLASIQHEYPMPYIPYKIGVYIRFYNQTQYSDEVYLEKHKQWFLDDISLCPRWSLVDFYIDYGSSAPHMESSKEWCRLLTDCFSGRVDLIVTQKAGNVSEDPQELALISRLLAAQKPPVGIYFISEDIFTMASYYRESLTDRAMLTEDWKVLPKDELDLPMIGGTEVLPLSIEGTNATREEKSEDLQAYLSEEGGTHA